MRRVGWLVVLCCGGCFDLDQLTMGGADGAAAAGMDQGVPDLGLADLAGSDLAGSDLAAGPPDLVVLDLLTVYDLAQGDGGPCKNANECGGGTHDCCNGFCVDTAISASNCSACGNVCKMETNATVGCVASSCKILSCAPNYQDCNGKYDDGCEVFTLVDAQNCGGCGRACSQSHAAEICTGGHCMISVCLNGYKDCDNDPSNGCEVDALDDPNHCGSCGVTNCFMCSAGNCIPGGDMTSPADMSGPACGAPAACKMGADPISGNSYVVCGNGPRIAQANGLGGTKYYVDLICQCFGYTQATGVGTDVLNSCINTCMAPGPYQAGNPPCGFDMMNRYFCTSGAPQLGLEWMCK